MTNPDKGKMCSTGRIFCAELDCGAQILTCGRTSPGHGGWNKACQEAFDLGWGPWIEDDWFWACPIHSEKEIVS